MISEQLRLLIFLFFYDQSACPFVCQYSYFFIKELTSIKYQGGSLARYFTVNEIKIDPFMRQIKKDFEEIGGTEIIPQYYIQYFA